jgi:hypothetical protein
MEKRTAMNKNDFPQDIIDQMGATKPIEVTPEVIHHAAAGMTKLLWRNTSTVETEAHAEGDWDDADMLRMNTRVTKVLREALTELCATPNEEGSGELLLDAMRDICDLLPTEAMKDSLWDESHRKADFWGSAMSAFGPDRVLTIFTQGPAGMIVTCNRDWWGHPDYPARVTGLAAANPPNPETFTERALNQPWDLSDEQAQFITDLRYETAPWET